MRWCQVAVAGARVSYLIASTVRIRHFWAAGRAQNARRHERCLTGAVRRGHAGTESAVGVFT